MTQNHKDTLKLLTPIELGDEHASDLELEGQHLDQARDRATVLLANIFADTTYELLTDWERTLGLVPADDASITSRIAACVAKLRELGGLSKPYFIALADIMGYEIEIYEPWPFMAGIAGAGDRVYVSEIIWCWRVDVQDAEIPIYTFHAGISAAGDPLMAFDTLGIEEVFEALKPAHTFVYFAYIYYQDFTDYIEADPNSRIAVAKREITFEDLTRNEDAWVRYNFGTGYFSGNFQHQVVVAATGHLDAGIVAVWALTNIIDDLVGIDTASGDYLAVELLYDTGASKYKLRIEEVDGGTPYTDDYEISVDTDYYLTISRDESVGTYGTLYCYIYSDAERTTLLDTLSLALHTSKKDFTHLFALNTYNSGDAAKTLDGKIADLKIITAT